MGIYVSRPLVNGAGLLAWAASWIPAELLVKPADMHVTLCYSKTDFDIGQILPAPTTWVVIAEKLHIERLGDNGEYLALCFRSVEFERRWAAFIGAGASWDWGRYQPHVTLALGDTSAIQIPMIIPEISLWFGPENVEPLDESWTGGDAA